MIVNGSATMTIAKKKEGGWWVGGWTTGRECFCSILEKESVAMRWLKSIQ